MDFETGSCYIAQSGMDLIVYGTLLSLPLQHCSYRSAVTDYMGAGDLNTSPRPCMANTILTELVPHLLILNYIFV